MSLKPAVLDIVARVSSRVFLGEELCRNEEWLRITKSYTSIVFGAALTLRAYPRVLRPLVHWFLPQCKEVRTVAAEAEKLLKPVVHQRRQLQAAALAKGEPVPVFNDTVEWAEAEAEARGAPLSIYDSATFQLNMSVAAIHTTTDLAMQTIITLARFPDVIPELRDEIVSVLRKEGWNKSALFNMKLLDSVIKETQRLKPINLGTCKSFIQDFTQNRPVNKMI